MVLVLLLSGLITSGYFRRRAYQSGGRISRAAEGRPLQAARLLVALPLFLMMATYIIRPSLLPWSELPLPLWLRWAGVGLGALSVVGAGWTLAHLGRNVSETVLTRSGQELVVTGPYHWVRHPLYTAGMGLIVGIGLAAANGLILSWAIVVLFGVLGLVIPKEERELTARFGDAYREHRVRTGRLLPSWRRRRP